MKRYLPVWFCLLMVAINLPWALAGSVVNIASASFCSACALACYFMARTTR